MIKFIKKIINSEFLPVSEVRKLKVYLVMLFLFVITLVTIPISFIFEYSLPVRIIALAIFVLTYSLSFVLVKLNKFFTAIQLTIIYSIALTIFYTRGISSFYAYIFFFITLTIIVFYQEIYSYFVYGTLTLVLGILYTLSSSEGLVVVNDIRGSIYIYIAALALYYLVSFLQIINNEKLYTDLNLEWVKLNHVNKNYQEDILFYLEEMRIDQNKTSLYEDLEFQKAVVEISKFVAQQILKDGKEIVNIVDLYVYIHEKGLDAILNNKEVSIALKRNANMLGKYLLNENSDMLSLLISFYLTQQPTDKYDKDRYNYRLNQITEHTDEQFLAFALIYFYLDNEINYGFRWNNQSKLTKVEDIFLNHDLSKYFSSELITFYLENQSLFEKYAKNN
jgi:hypothetical protein